MIEPIDSLAFSMHGNKGVYALLLGSGVSRAARIPAGWEIILVPFPVFGHLLRAASFDESRSKNRRLLFVPVPAVARVNAKAAAVVLRHADHIHAEQDLQPSGIHCVVEPLPAIGRE